MLLSLPVVPVLSFISLAFVSWFVATRESSSAAAAGGSCLLGSVHSSQTLISQVTFQPVCSASQLNTKLVEKYQFGQRMRGSFLLLLAKE